MNSYNVLSSLLRRCHPCAFRQIMFLSTEVEPLRMAYTSVKSTSPQASTSPPLVIMHGLLGSKKNWKSLSKAISQKTGRAVFAVDARNHGESPFRDEFTYYDLANDIIAFLKEHSIPKACLVGHSMGGRAVMAAAFLKPKMIEKLFVLDMSPVGVSEGPSSLPLFVDVLRETEIPQGLKLQEARQYVDTILQEVVPDKFLRMFLLTNLIESDGKFVWTVNLKSIAENYEFNLRRFPPAEDGHTFVGPTYFLGGALSNYIRKSDHEKILKFFPDAQFHYLEDAGHWLHSDKPKEFVELISSLINR